MASAAMEIVAAKPSTKAIYACDVNTSYFADLQNTVKPTGSDTIVECRILDVLSEGPNPQPNTDIEVLLSIGDGL
ncbi:levodione reductase [Penicillium verrucosum]|uniref:levodione reductase n=1 Tax=Penicillium verrucosum TaxID=60171 RepID=UPI00254596AC|nr:levodione reductase [Penicillium verrucosum]KAJ5943991.1 levodione reductase [Penicillium verrucosum]